MMYTLDMKRTQILLENRQYDALRTRARREDKSLSEIIRQAVDQWLGYDKPAEGSSKLSEICGIFSDPTGFSGADHDEIIYGLNKKDWKK